MGLSSLRFKSSSKTLAEAATSASSLPVLCVRSRQGLEQNGSGGASYAHPEGYQVTRRKKILECRKMLSRQP